MNLFKKDETKEVEQKEELLYTEEQLMARLKFFIGVCLALTLVGIVFVVLYSLIFVTQPMNAISPMDQKFFELIIPIATFLTGTLSGIMLAGNDKDARMEAIKAATKGGSPSPAPSTPSTGGGFSASASFGGANMSFSKPAAAPSAFGAAPAAPAATFGAAPAAPAMSSTGKPMPVQPEEPEL